MPHIHEKIDFTVDVYIVHKNKVLIRKHDKYGMWCAPGGHIELDENPNQAVIREAKEEVGLDITLLEPRKRWTIPHQNRRELTPPFFMNIHPVNETHQHNSLTYFATSESDTVVPEKPTDEWKWLTVEELEQNELGIGEEYLF